MSSQTPLKIPEILWEVSQRVTGRTLLACVRVSKVWYQAFLPQIWRHIELTQNKPHLPGAIHGYMYSRFVKTLKIYCIPGREYSSLILPNLASLTVENADWNDNLFKLVSNHPMLIHLDIKRKMETHSTRCLGLLTSLHSLKDVTLMGLELNETNVDTFWQLCAQLERLIVSFQRISIQDTLPAMEFPHMRLLRASDFSEDNIPWVLEFMQRCPGLRSLGSLAHFPNRLLIPKVTPLIRARKWPHLQSLALWMFSKDEDDLAGIIASMEKITPWKLHCSCSPLP